MPSRPRFFLAAFLVPFTASSAVVDDFNDGNDAGWTRLSPLEDFGAGAAYTFPAGGYRVEAAASPAPQLVGPARAGAYRADETFADFDLAIDIGALAGSSLDTDIGLLARLSDIGLGTTDGYGLFYDLGGGVLSLLRIEDEGDYELARFDFATPLDLTKSYRLRLIGAGASLIGTIADLAAPATPLAMISGSDATYADGFTGLLVYDDSPAGDQPAAGTFDNFSVTIPEPSAAATVALGVLALSVRRRYSPSIASSERSN